MWAYVGIVASALAGLVGLAAYRARDLRGRVVWGITIAAEVAMLVQVLTGVILISNDSYTVARFHVFYGVLVFITIAIAYGYRKSMGSRTLLYYGLISLFVMGLGIRAIVEVSV